MTGSWSSEGSRPNDSLRPSNQSIRRNSDAMVHRDGEGTSSSRVGSMEPYKTELGAQHPGEAGILQQTQRFRRSPPAPTPLAGQRGCMKKVWIALTAMLVTFVTIQFVLPPSG